MVTGIYSLLQRIGQGGMDEVRFAPNSIWLAGLLLIVSIASSAQSPSITEYANPSP
jgi:hypothetical protein